MGNYILQTIAFQLVFLLVYELLLKKETFFTYNRIYLLLSPVLAMILPLLNFPVLQNAVPAETAVLLPEVFLGTKPTAETASEIPVMIGEANAIGWLWLCYGIGVLGSIVFFLKKYTALKRLFRNPVISETPEFRIIRVHNSDLACTYFSTIFLGDRLKAQEAEQILSHELVHVKHKHSFDLLFFELLKILFWFNPLIYIYQSRISVLHEFIADEGVVKKVKKQDYFQQILNTAFGTNNISFVNQFFNHSIIKKRIVMLQKSRSKTIAKFKYLILLPLMLLMLTYVACSDDPAVPKVEQEATAQQKLEQIKAIVEDGTPVSEADKEEISQILSTISSTDLDKSVQKEQVQKLKNATSPGGDVPFAVIEEVPVFPGCEDLSDNEAKKECLSQNIINVVNKNFNTALGKELGLTGVNRIYVQFKITSQGDVEVMGVRAAKPELEEEARRVVNLLPQMTPGKQGGEEVGVLYTLPITFRVAE